MSATAIDVLAPDEVWEDADPEVEGLLDDWLVAAGAEVAEGQAIAALMIVKTSFDLVAPAAGTIEEIVVPKGETFARDTVLVRLRAS